MSRQAATAIFMQPVEVELEDDVDKSCRRCYRPDQGWRPVRLATLDPGILDQYGDFLSDDNNSYRNNFSQQRI